MPAGVMNRVKRWFRPNVNGHVGRPVYDAHAALGKEAKAERRDLHKIVTNVERDYQFSFARLIIDALISSIPVSIKTNSTDVRAVKLAANLQTILESHLPEMLTCIGYGRAAFEITYKPSGRDNLITIDSLDFIEYVDSEMLLDEDGGFRGVKVKLKQQPEIELPPQDVWWLALDPTPKQPHGRSRYVDQVWEVYKLRDELRKNWKTWLDKFALGQGVMKAPSSYPPDPPGIRGKGSHQSVDSSGQPKSPLQDGLAMLRSLRSGGVAVLPSEVDPKTGQPYWDYQSPQTKQDANPLENRQTNLDAAALRAMGVPERAITQDANTGSLALATAHLKPLYHVIEGIFSQIVTSYERYVIRKVVRLNFDEQSAVTFEVDWQPLGESDRAAAIGELLSEILRGGTVSPLLTEGVIDLPALLEQSDLPVGTNPAEALARIREAVGSTSAVTLPGITPSPAIQQSRQLARTDDDPPDIGTWIAQAARMRELIAAKRGELMAALEDRDAVAAGGARRSL